MGRQRKTPPDKIIPPPDLPDIYRPIDPDAREQHMIALAVNLAEQKLRDGTATSQIIEHYLKLGTARAQLEHDLMMEELELKRAKTDQIKAERVEEEKYQRAIDAMRLYSGHGDPEEYYDQEIF